MLFSETETYRGHRYIASRTTHKSKSDANAQAKRVREDGYGAIIRSTMLNGKLRYKVYTSRLGK